LKKRVDLILVEKKIAESRTKAQALIKTGQIFINGKKVLKSGELYDPDQNIISKYGHHQWVSRGALKLLHAIDYFKIDVTNFKCLDIGASTGGFTEVLLSKKVKKIYCVDVGTNQLHDRLINNARILNIQKTNAKSLTRDIITELVDVVVCDVSFISMKKVIYPSLVFLKKKTGIIIALIKPQFELEKKEMKKNGIVTDQTIHERICNDYKNWFKLTCNMKVLGIIRSPIDGIKGNAEFLIYAKNNYKY
jgi:23S rRNA (cytidine1920-2'-O)/16S rRNA (cytidine1409-2'-O)-methyltransferase